MHLVLYIGHNLHPLAPALSLPILVGGFYGFVRMFFDAARWLRRELAAPAAITPDIE